MSERTKEMETIFEDTLKTTQAKRAFELMKECVTMLDQKQLCYGPGNIAAFADYGCLVRGNDKIERLKTLYSNEDQAPFFESIEDSWMDLCNYSIIALMCMKGEWE